VRSRVQRADAIRPLVRHFIESSSVREAERATGISRTVLHDFAFGGKTPQEKNLTALEEWVRSSGLAAEATSGQEVEGALDSEARTAYDFLTTTLRAQRGRHPDADPELIKDAIRGAIEEARARGWPLAPLYELLGRVESGDF
jgi:hypothetical protein